MASVFRAYDIRGIYPKEINEALVAEIADCLGQHFFVKGIVVLGYDARKSSPRLYRAVIKTLEDSKFKVVKAGLITTPMFHFLVSRLRASGGIMVTASHNPKEYNGLIMAGKKVKPISGEEVRKMI